MFQLSNFHLLSPVPAPKPASGESLQQLANDFFAKMRPPAQGQNLLGTVLNSGQQHAPQMPPLLTHLFGG